ncbi:MAG TPA: hypothetical protein VID27_05210 [Blastocatellia bacterium]|jgi:hypothetical protein
MAAGLNKMALLEKLERIKYEKEDEREQSHLEQMSLAGSLLLLAEINHEREYALSRAVAEHLLGEVPEPDDADLGEE